MTDQDMEALFPEKKVVVFQGTSLEISPLTMRQLPAFAKAVTPIVMDLQKAITRDGENLVFNGVQLLELLASDGEALIKSVSIGANVPEDTLLDVYPDEFLKLLMAVLEVNIDFFMRQILPTLEKEVAKAADLMAGSMQSND